MGSVEFRICPEAMFRGLKALPGYERISTKAQVFWVFGALTLIRPISPGRERLRDDCLASALLAKLQDERLKPQALGRLLSGLLDHKVGEARAFAETLISPLSFPDEDRRSQAIISACALMTHAEDAGWLIVWPAIQQDSEFGREAVAGVIYNAGLGPMKIAQMAEDQLADFYIWLARQYPHVEDPRYEGAHSVGPRESIADFRDALLRYLKERGTSQACEAIRQIAIELPELDWLKWTLLEAQAIARRHTWVPPQPREILATAGTQHKRLVQGGGQLLEVIIESLQRLEAKLQGETPQAVFLWNQIGKGVYKPKDENLFSDYVKSHLDEDLKQKGVIVNREVEIRRGEGTGKGEQTDIHVDAPSAEAQAERNTTVSLSLSKRRAAGTET